MTTRDGQRIAQINNSATGKSRSGFTLVEVVTMASVITLAATLLLPRLGNAGLRARSTQCANNLRQIGMATSLYSLDNHNRLPGCQHSLPNWAPGLANYTSIQNYSCPDDSLPPMTESPDVRDHSYAINDFLTPHPYGARELDYSRSISIPSPSLTLLFAEKGEDYRAYDHFHFADHRENGFRPDRFGEQVAAQRHGGSASYLHADGHVVPLPWDSQVQTLLQTSGSRFVHPEGKSASEYASSPGTRTN